MKKKGGTKKYQKVCERLGRLKEKYAKVAQYYSVEVEQKNDLAVNITWQYLKKKQAEQRFSGTYYIRTDRTDLKEQEIWQIYAMLTDVEAAFRAMKSEIGLRPNFHQIETRCDGHLFITVVAYHILHCIRTRLKQVGINHHWATIRKLLASHGRITTSLKTESGKTIHLRKCTTPEAFQKTIYSALNMETIPCAPTKTIT